MPCHVKNAGGTWAQLTWKRIPATNLTDYVNFEGGISLVPAREADSASESDELRREPGRNCWTPRSRRSALGYPRTRTNESEPIVRMPDLLQSLGLEPHAEGGYYRRTYTSAHQSNNRPAMSSIYYALTQDSPIGHWHRVQSDIIHYFHSGGTMRYRILDESGKLGEALLGPGHFQLLVPANTWKCSELIEGEFGLLSEAVSPGFGENYHEFAHADELASKFPEHETVIRRYAKLD